MWNIYTYILSYFHVFFKKDHLLFSVMACHLIIKFGDHRYGSSRYIMILVCHVIKQDHVVKGCSDCKKRNPLRYVATVSSLVVIGTVGVEI